MSIEIFKIPNAYQIARDIRERGPLLEAQKFLQQGELEKANALLLKVRAIPNELNAEQPSKFVQERLRRIQARLPQGPIVMTNRLTNRSAQWPLDINFKGMPGGLPGLICSFFFIKQEEPCKKADQRELAAFALTCKGFYRASRECIGRAWETSQLSDQVITKDEFYSRLQELDKSSPEEIAASLAREYPRMHAWHVDRNGMALTAKEWRKLFEVLALLPQVTSLTLINCWIRGGGGPGLSPELFKLIGQCQQLQELTYGRGPLSDDALAELANCKGLTTLDIHEATGYTEKGLSYLQLLPKLSTVRLSENQSNPDIELEALAALPSLSTCKLRWNPNMDVLPDFAARITSVMPRFFDHAGKCTSLTINQPFYVPFAAFERLNQWSGRLQALHLDVGFQFIENENVYDRVAPLINRCSLLTDLSMPRHFSNENAANAVRGLAHLRSLSLYDMDNGVAKAVATCPELRSLRVSTSSCTVVGAREIIKGCSKLEEVFGTDIIPFDLLELQNLPQLKSIQINIVDHELSISRAKRLFSAISLRNRRLVAILSPQRPDKEKGRSFRVQYDRHTLLNFVQLQVAFLVACNRGQPYEKSNEGLQEGLKLLEELAPRYHQHYVDALKASASANAALHLRRASALSYLSRYANLQSDYEEVQARILHAELGIDTIEVPEEGASLFEVRYDNACRFFNVKIDFLKNLTFKTRLDILHRVRTSILLEMIRDNLQNGDASGCQESADKLRAANFEMFAAVATILNNDKPMQQRLAEINTLLADFFPKDNKAPSPDRKDGT